MLEIKKDLPVFHGPSTAECLSGRTRPRTPSHHLYCKRRDCRIIKDEDRRSDSTPQNDVSAAV
jgi:hypothetical protein